MQLDSYELLATNSELHKKGIDFSPKPPAGLKRLAGYAWNVLHPARLAGGFQYVQPEHAFGINEFAVANGDINGNVRETVVPDADQHTGFTGHTGMNRVLRQLVAENAVRRNRA
jgi:hypothetical protein